MSLALPNSMDLPRRALLTLLLLAGCDVGSVDGNEEVATLRVEPASIELTVELDEALTTPLHVFLGDREVTADADFVMEGAELGIVNTGGFTSDARTGGSASVTVSYEGASVSLPLRVVLHSVRGDAPFDAPTWFADATPSAVPAVIEPGDGTVLPPNLATLDVQFQVPIDDDVHELAITSTNLDLHVYGRGTEGGRAIALTAAEWDAVSRSTRGSGVDLTVRSLSSVEPTISHVASSQLAVAELPIASEVLFTGRHPGEAIARIWSYEFARGTTEEWISAPDNTCMGCHLAISRDGRRIAAAGMYAGAEGDVFGGGAIVDTSTRELVAAPSAAIGNWESVAFDPSGALVTAHVGSLMLRDGETALPIAPITTETLAAQPAISVDGTLLAYTTGTIDPASNPALPNLLQEELLIHDWNAATASLGPARILAGKEEGSFVKLPDFSPDDRWVLFSRLPASTVVMGDIMAVPSDGSAAPIKLASDYDMARFASPIVAARSGGPEAEPMVWIIMKSDRAVAGRAATGQRQLWAMAFFPEQGISSQPFALPGQDQEIDVIHAPAVIMTP